MVMSGGGVGQVIVSGLAMGSIYALVALGFLLIFNAVRIVNFAQGQFLMLGAFLAISSVVGAKLPPYIAYPLTCLAMAILGLVFMLVAYFPLKGKSPTLVILTTIAMGIVLENLALIVWGPLPLSLPAAISMPPLRLLGVVVPAQSLFIFAVTGVLLLVSYFVLTRTPFGLMMQATSQDLEMARLIGIRVNVPIAAAFAVGTAFAGLAGLLVAPLFLADTSMGGSLGLKGFVVSVLGGFGHLPGAVIGGLILGVIEALAARFISSDYRDAYSFLILIAVLFLRPQGLFGEKASERV
jgi:branched-chain amino acid transport system permease protein